MRDTTELYTDLQLLIRTFTPIAYHLTFDFPFNICRRLRNGITIHLATYGAPQRLTRILTGARIFTRAYDRAPLIIRRCLSANSLALVPTSLSMASLHCVMKSPEKVTSASMFQLYRRYHTENKGIIAVNSCSMKKDAIVGIGLASRRLSK